MLHRSSLPRKLIILLIRLINNSQLTEVDSNKTVNEFDDFFEYLNLFAYCKFLSVFFYIMRLEICIEMDSEIQFIHKYSPYTSLA